MLLGLEHNEFTACCTRSFWPNVPARVCTCFRALLPPRLCVLSNSKALAPHSSSRSPLTRSTVSSLLPSPSQDTLWTGLCSERWADAEGGLGATLHTAIPLRLAAPLMLDMSDRKLLNCREGREIQNRGGSYGDANICRFLSRHFLGFLTTADIKSSVISAVTHKSQEFQVSTPDCLHWKRACHCLGSSCPGWWHLLVEESGLSGAPWPAEGLRRCLPPRRTCSRSPVNRTRGQLWTQSLRHPCQSCAACRPSPWRR